MGASYEGAIVPGPLVPRDLTSEGESPWTPSDADVQAFEQEFVSYLRRAAEGTPVQPVIEFHSTHPPRDLQELREFIEFLPKSRRQYFGLMIAGRRELYAKAAVTEDWRNEVGFMLDGACGNWAVRFDVTRGQVLKFFCSGDP